MKNITAPPVEVNCGRTVIKVQHAVKNALIIGSDKVFLRVNKIEDDFASMNYNFTKEGGEMKNKIKELSRLCRKNRRRHSCSSA